MKGIDFTSCENVVNIESPEKINIIGEHSYSNNGSVLLAAINKKNRFKSKINKDVNHSRVFSKNFVAFVSCVPYPCFNKVNKKLTIYQAMPIKISIRINN